MQRLYTPEKSFVAYIDWNESDNTLLVTFRKNGHQYSYSNFTKRHFDRLKDATNKGSYIAINVINSKKHIGSFVQIVPMADIEAITMPHTKYYRNFLAR